MHVLCKNPEKSLCWSKKKSLSLSRFWVSELFVRETKKMSAYRWKSFYEDEDRPEKPRRYGVTEMRGPHYTLLSQNILQVSLSSISLSVSSSTRMLLSISNFKDFIVYREWYRMVVGFGISFRIELLILQLVKIHSLISNSGKRKDSLSLLTKP